MLRSAAMLLVLVAACWLALAADSCDRRPGRAGVSPVVAGEAGPPPVVRADIAGPQALRTIEEAGQREVAAIGRGMQWLPDGRKRREMEQAVRQVRHATSEQLLEAEAELARQRGDENQARQAQRRLRLMHEDLPR